MAMKLLVLTISFCFSLSWQLDEKIEFENYNPGELTNSLPGYGETWMYFPSSNGTPVVVQLEPEIELSTRMKPLSMKKNVLFYLYTRSNKQSGQVLDLENPSSLHNSNFNLANPIKFIIHGWTSSYESDSSQITKDKFLENGDFNVILVDWNKLASNLVYPVSAMETVNVGDYVGKFVDFLVENGADLENIHLIGHSLGAHVAGRAGYAAKSGKVKRVTGLDPALPGFELPQTSNENKLDTSDAQFVDVIHTCGGILGYYSKLGHADFYPNGGVPAQPGCLGLPQFIEGCSHGKSWEYFADSIKSKNNFLGTLCDSWKNYKNGKCSDNTQIPMGVATPDSFHGVYYLRTGEEKDLFRAVGDAVREVPSFINEAIRNAKNGLKKIIPIF